MMDFSDLHTPIGALGPLPTHKQDWQQYRLTDEQVEAFHRDGFLAGVEVLEDHQVETLCAELAELMEPSHPSHERFWHDQLFRKPAYHGGVVAWHQDYSYWTRTQPMAHLTCWMALDDSTRENGCLYYIPGSHKWNLLPITGLAGDMNEIMTVLDEEQKQAFRPVPIELKRGQCSFHHPLTVHGSYENRSDRPRRATLVNVFRDGVRSASDEPLLAGVPVIPKGQKMEGRFFPLLFEPGVMGN
jgi:ectoine hydroxylase-related dioxygenase (phytanoyl-CoA dioxygenase family)